MSSSSSPDLPCAVPASRSSSPASMLLGKRHRLIRRTTSMSHLQPRPGPPPKSSSGPPPPPPAAPPLASIPPLDDDSMLDTDCEMLQNGVSMMSIEDSSSDAQQSMAIDMSVAASSPSDRSSDSQAAHHWPSPAIPGSPVPALGSTPASARPEAAQSIRRGGHFLDVCFFCDRRLQGRDIFMYRGDRAFCSSEWRHHQIAADERREKCAVTAVKKGGATPSVNTTSSKQVVPAETAAAA